ncbi:MAG TPA: hypothetical protein VFI25_02895 [Planctomycetota bacterium]|jgi:hypothetical protein|nr:hypothetical protein [Planctomycetota bacterium]
MRRTSTEGRRPPRLSSGRRDGLERLEGGIDEAGFGPLLGPLCVGYAAFDRPSEAPDLWSLLARAVAPRPPRAGAPDLPAVCDSKVLYPGAGGFARLERAALLFLSLARGGRPATIRGLLEGPFAPSRGDLDAHPWYRDLDLPLPRRAPVEVLEADLDRARPVAEGAGVRVRVAGVRVVPERAFNEGVRRHGNKASFHLDLVVDLLRHLATLPRRGEGTILVDRLGGRRFYRLEALLPEFLPTPLREEPARSEYLLHGEARGARLSFCVGGEHLSFPCALASVLAKYAREILVERLNAHFLALLPGLRRTAGYFEDGWRFLGDLRRRLAPEEVPLDLLVRLR